MKLSHLRDIVAVSTFGSLRAAGRHLNIAQPAITRSIRDIEQELGVTLFERHAKGVKLTPMGEAFVRRAEAVEGELRRAREEIEQLKGRTTGEVSIGLSTASVMSLMPTITANFRRRYPDGVLKVSECFFQQIEGDLLNGKADLYVGPLDQNFSSPHFVVERLFDNHRMVLARKGHPLAAARSLRDLADAKWIRPSLSERSTEGDFDAVFDSFGLPRPQIVMHARSALVTLVAVANSDMLTILPRQWLQFTESANLLMSLDIVDPMPAPPMCIVRRQDMPLTPMAEHLYDLVRRAGLHHAARQAQMQAVA